MLAHSFRYSVDNMREVALTYKVVSNLLYVVLKYVNRLVHASEIFLVSVVLRYSGAHMLQMNKYCTPLRSEFVLYESKEHMEK